MAGLAQERTQTPECDRRRISLLVGLAATAADFSPKLSHAVDRASDSEVRIMADLLDLGLSVPALVHFLQGAHVIVGEDSLYERWIFPKSRRRMSSHHRMIDKETTPDYGLDGPLVRESLHGKAPIGTWIQLERTKASFQWGKLPTLDDVIHMRDYLLYRVTGKNVGPWGLSAHVDTRPMLLRPAHIRIGEGADSALDGLSRHRDEVRDQARQQRWSDVLTPEIPDVGPLADLYRPQDPANPRELLPEAPYLPELGSGLFASLYLTPAPAPLSDGITEILDREGPEAFLEPVEAPQSQPRTIRVRKHEITTMGRVRTAGGQTKFIGLEGDSA